MFRLANGDFVPVSIHCANTVLHRGLDVACVLRNAATSIIFGMHSGCMEGCVEGRVILDLYHLCWDNTSYPHHAEGQSKLAASVRVNFLKDHRTHRISTSVFVTLCVTVGYSPSDLVRVTVPAIQRSIEVTVLVIQKSEGSLW